MEGMPTSVSHQSSASGGQQQDLFRFAPAPAMHNMGISLPFAEECFNNMCPATSDIPCSGLLNEGEPPRKRVLDLPWILAVGEYRQLVAMEEYRTNWGEPLRKRFLSRNWTRDEIFALLKWRAEAGRVHAKRVWHYVSEKLFLCDGYDRDSKSCEHLWGDLIRPYRAVRDYEANSGNLRNIINFGHRSWLRIDLDWYKTMERILNAQSTRNILLREAETEELDQGLSDGTFEPQAVLTTDSHVPHSDTSLEDCHETNSKYAGRKRRAAPDEEGLMATITPLFSKHLDAALQPLMSALRSAQEDELQHRHKMQAIEAQMLALKRKETRTSHSLAKPPGAKVEILRQHADSSLAVVA